MLSLSLLRSLSIGRRLAVVLSVILGLSLVSSGVAGFKLRDLGQQLTSMYDDSLQVERAVTDWMAHTSVNVARGTAVARSDDLSLAALFAPAMQKTSADISVLQKSLEARLDRPDEKALFQRIAAQRAAYVAVRDDLSALRKSGQTEALYKAFAERFQPAAEAYLASLRQLQEMQRQEYDAAAARVAPCVPTPC